MTQDPQGARGVGGGQAGADRRRGSGDTPGGTQGGSAQVAVRSLFGERGALAQALPFGGIAPAPRPLFVLPGAAGERRGGGKRRAAERAGAERGMEEEGMRGEGPGGEGEFAAAVERDTLEQAVDVTGVGDGAVAGQGGAPVAAALLEDEGAAVALYERPALPPVMTNDERAALVLERAALEGERAELAVLHERYQKALGTLAEADARDLRHLETEVLDLALLVAREIILREVRLDRALSIELVAAALAVITSEEATTVRVAAEDLAQVEAAGERLSAGRAGLLRFIADATLGPGECLVQAGAARVDGRLDERLQRVREALRGGATEVG